MPSSLEPLCDIKLKSDPLLRDMARMGSGMLPMKMSLIAPPQYEAAKNDFEYFMRLVDLALAYYSDRVEKGHPHVSGLWQPAQCFYA
jgi:hypothetical protein